MIRRCRPGAFLLLAGLVLLVGALIPAGAVLLSPGSLPLRIGVAHAAAPGERQFRAVDWATGGCVTIDATVVATGDHVIVYAADDRTLPDASLDVLVQDFDERVYPAVTEALGLPPEPGADGERRILVLIYDFGDPAVHGYFDPADLDAGAGTDPLAAQAEPPPETPSRIQPEPPPETPSRIQPEPPAETVVALAGSGNAAEILYLDRTAFLLAPELAGGTAAHELAHLIIYYRDVLLNEDGTPEHRWVQEGLSTWAERAAGFQARTTDGIAAFAGEPGDSLTDWGGFEVDYGSSTTFIAYLAERYGPEFLERLAGVEADGFAGVRAALDAEGHTETERELFGDWALSVFMDGRTSGPVPYGFEDLDIAVEAWQPDPPLPRTGFVDIEENGAAFVQLPPGGAGAGVKAILAVDSDSGFGDSGSGGYAGDLSAALVGWEEDGAEPGMVQRADFDAQAGGAVLRAPDGYDHYALVVWRYTGDADDGISGDPIRVNFAAGTGDETALFLDLDSGHRFFPYISVLAHLGVVSGHQEPAGSGLTYFDPDGPVLRAQLAKMLVGGLGFHTDEVEDRGDLFADVPSDGSSYPYDFVAESQEAGIVAGMADGTFHPWSPVTRIQLVRMILRGADARDLDLPAYEGQEQVFADVGPENPLYPEVMAAYEAGLMSGGYGADGRLYFWPWTEASRGHVSKMTANVIELIGY